MSVMQKQLKKGRIMKRLLLLLPLCLGACGFEIVDTGRRGVSVNLGKVVGEPLPEGMHFYNPFTSSIVEIDVQQRGSEETTDCFTKDTQKASITYSLMYYPDPSKVHLLYQEYGSAWQDKVIKPITLGSIKDAIGQQIADDLVGKREIVAQAALAEVKKNLAERYIMATGLQFTNIDFDDAYENAVEQKVVAIQQAAQAKNNTVKVKEEALQTVATAQAEAEAMRIKSQALAQNKGLVQFEAVQKWDGKLPVNMYGSAPLPFLNLKGE